MAPPPSPVPTRGGVPFEFTNQLFNASTPLTSALDWFPIKWEFVTFTDTVGVEVRRMFKYAASPRAPPAESAVLFRKVEFVIVSGVESIFTAPPEVLA
jgi:hypothetical protein